jgi:MFS family permease
MGEHVGQRAKRSFFTYQDGVAVLMGLTFGTVLFDRGAISFLSPFIVADLRLTNAQLGLAAAVISLTWALAGFLVGRASDAAGRRKPYLIAAVVAFSLCSAASGLVGSFAMLIGVRLAMGLAEGSVPPLAATLLLGASADHRRGLNMGIYAVFTGLVGSVLAPIVLVGLASHFGWRITFFLAGVPGLVLAAAIALWVREVRPVTAATPEQPSHPLEILRVRNVRLCAVIASLLLGCAAITMIFLPLYLVQDRRLSPLDMGLVMTALGAATLAASLILPTLSDQLGRKAVLVGFAGLGAILPIGCLYWTGGIMGLTAICTFGALPGALLHVAIGIAPGESVHARDRGAALGLVMGCAELVGGFITPSLVGLLADRAGLGMALNIGGSFAVAAALLSVCLRETAPRFTTRRAKLQVALETS